MYNCSKCGFSTADKKTFEAHLESCYGPRLPWWFHSQLRANLVALIVTWSIIAIIVTAHAAPQSPLAVEVVSGDTPAAQMPVTATKDTALVVVTTDSDGFASFGNLEPGEWHVETCGQTLTYTSSPGNDDIMAIWHVDCLPYRVWLPIVNR